MLKISVEGIKDPIDLDSRHFSHCLEWFLGFQYSLSITDSECPKNVFKFVFFYVADGYNNGGIAILSALVRTEREMGRRDRHKIEEFWTKERGTFGWLNCSKNG